MKRIPIILDVDTGIDDAMAIALATRSDTCELVAVTTVAGNTTIDNATRNSLDVLDMLGRSDVPVHRGASRPLVRPLQQAAHVHGNNGIGGAVLPESTRDVGADRGPAAMIRLVKERPGEITLVCVGPLTNLAIALNVEPRFPEYLRRLVIMGGAYFVPGNVTPAAEFNFYCDPEAADQVLRTPFPDLIAIGLDVSHQVALPRSLWEAVRDDRSRRPNWFQSRWNRCSRRAIEPASISTMRLLLGSRSIHLSLFLSCRRCRYWLEMMSEVLRDRHRWHLSVLRATSMPNGSLMGSAIG